MPVPLASRGTRRRADPGWPLALLAALLITALALHSNRLDSRLATRQT
jgi:hypothetical protein